MSLMSLEWPVLWPVGAFVVTTVIALVLRRIVLASLDRWVPMSDLLSVCTSALRGPSLWWCVVLGLYVANQVAEDFALLPVRWHRQLAMVLHVAVILSITVTLAGLAGRVTARAAQRQLLGGAVTGLAQTTSRVAVLVVGLLVLLSTLGIQITPILATLGVGGLAVALALQDTLSNLFAGIHLLADQSLRVGSYVKVADQAEGFVLDVGWRSTRIRSLSNDVLVVPNQTVARATITNYAPSPPREAMALRVSVEPSADPEKVKRVLLEEVTLSLGQIPALLAEPAPAVNVVPASGASTLDFTVGYHVAPLADQRPVQDELLRRILDRLQREDVTALVPRRAAVS